MITIYVTKPVTDARILPTTVLPDDAISNDIIVGGSPGEYVPATFTIRTPEDISQLLPVCHLAGLDVDIRYVKCWLQAPESYSTHNSGGLYIYNKIKVLTPELLLKDDSLVKVENNENYVKLTTGEYEWVSEFKELTEPVYTKVEDFPVRDSDNLQPVDIPAGTNKQVWITIKIPGIIQPGTYTGVIDLTTPIGSIGQVQLQVEVYNIQLLEPMLTYSIFYAGRWGYGADPSGNIGNLRIPSQIRAELINMREHGVPYPSCMQWWPWGTDRLGTYMSLRNDLGMPVDTFYYNEQRVSDQPQDYEALRNKLQEIKDFLAGYGVQELYTYLPDEQEIVEETRRQIEIAHEAGVKCFVALGKDKAERAADILDLAIAAYEPDANLAALYHSYGHKVFSYANPQVGAELPRTYRKNYGLLLWQRDYDGAMDYCYVAQQGFIWNDFDHVHYKDHLFAMPTMDGVIDTLPWEGFREAVTDIRYLTTLLNAIEVAQAQGRDTSAAENYLTSLKKSNLTTKNLDQVRQEIIVHILYLQGEPVEPPVPPKPPALPVALWGILPFFPWEGPPLPRFTALTWRTILPA